ncbi:unnamed protein product [Agarophyton chilense]
MPRCATLHVPSPGGSSPTLHTFFFLRDLWKYLSPSLPVALVAIVSASILPPVMNEKTGTSTMYSPWPVPEHSERPSIRDDVRRILYDNAFKPSATHYTLVEDIYQLYLRHTTQTHSAQQHERFRSALGRVLHPPHSAGQYALSYKANVTRWRQYISLVSPRCASIDMKHTVRQLKRDNALTRIERAKHSEHVAQLRTIRHMRKEQRTEQQQHNPPQPLSFRYVDEFLALNCAEDLTRLKVFPNGKELAESMSAYAAVRQFLVKHGPTHQEQAGVLSFSARSVTLVAVGDGVTPRTAAMFAFRTSWKCISIDPMMRKGEWDNVKNLRTIAARVQDVTIDVECNSRVVIVMWHCHTSILDSVSCLRFLEADLRERSFRQRVAVVSCACCNYDEVQKELPDGSVPDVQFEDTGVPGLMRTVRVWRFLS